MGLVESSAEPTLAQVVAALGPGTVVLLNETTVSGSRVGGARLWDPSDLAGLAPGDVVLGVNVTSTAARDVLPRLGSLRVAALALKGDGPELSELAIAAEDHGVGLLALAPDVTWDQFYSLIQRAASTLGPQQDDQPTMGDLFALSNALAALIGGAVVVEDPHGNLLAYSNLDQAIDEPRRQTILGRGNPSSWSQLLADEGLYRELALAPDGVIRINDPQGRANERVATLIRAGSEVLGSIWVVAGDTPLGPEAESVLRDATPLAAVHLLRHRTHHDSSRRERGQRLRALLNGEIGPAGELGIDKESTCQVVAFHLADLDDDVQLAVSRSRVIDAITMACEAFRRRVVCAWIGPTIYALFPDMSPASSSRLTSLTTDICGRTTMALGVAVVAGISAPHEGLAAVTHCRAEADRVVRVLTESPDIADPRQVAGIEDVRIASVLLTLADVVRERADLRVPKVATLATHDAAHAKVYVPTLRAFINASGSIPLAATTLGIHPNTMRYRVRRIEAISGLDLADPSHRLVAALELLVLPAP